MPFLPFPTPRNVFLPIESSTFEVGELSPEQMEGVRRTSEAIIRQIEDESLRLALRSDALSPHLRTTARGDEATLTYADLELAMRELPPRADERERVHDYSASPRTIKRLLNAFADPTRIPESMPGITTRHLLGIPLVDCPYLPLNMLVGRDRDGNVVHTIVLTD